MAGSGKANSIPRLAPRLSGLRNDGAPVVGSIISTPLALAQTVRRIKAAVAPAFDVMIAGGVPPALST